ncbi:MAG: hypothetical protein V4513_04100 [Pseudomonadota bacterium]
MADKQPKREPIEQEPPVNALLAYSPKMDLVGPTVNDDIRRAVQRYGAEAVKAAVKEATKAKIGRPREPDWPELKDIIHEDAVEWLNGGDPFAGRSNYSIAKAFAERRPGQSVVSTHKRIERKLSRGPYDRRWFVFVTAHDISRGGFPYAAHVRAIEAVASLPGMDPWQSMLDRARSTIADYEAREGKPPEASMSFAQIEEAVRLASLKAMLMPQIPDYLQTFGKPLGSH